MVTTTTMDIIFGEFLIFSTISTISNKYGIIESPHELPNDVRLIT